MRYLIALLLLCMLYACNSSKTALTQKRDYPTPFEFELIDTLSGTKDELFVKANEWICRTYGRAQTMIEMHDKQAGKLIGRSATKGNGDLVRYVISIHVKDGRYRCVISDFYHERTAGSISERNYGDLSAGRYVKRSGATDRLVEDKNYYAVKNEVMDNIAALQAYLKLWMRADEKDF